MGQAGALGLRYDRTQIREVNSSLFQLVFAFPEIRGTGAFVELRPIARFEKPDLDLELAIGWQDRDVGKVQTRVFFFDPFNNASDALAQNRGVNQELRVVQHGPSIGITGEVELAALRHLRIEAYGGGVLPSRARFDYLDDSQGYDSMREQWAVLGGAWLEWSIPVAPVWLGASASRVLTLEDDYNMAGGLFARTPEDEIRARAYALAHLSNDEISGFLGRLDLELVGSYRLTRLPGHEVRIAGKDRALPRDRSFMAMLRSQWMPTRFFGLELAYLVIDRQAEGDPELAAALSGLNHRLSTRFALAWDPHVRITFGVGWDLDDPSNRYDQGGMTLTARW